MRFFDRGITMRDDVIGEPDPRKRTAVADDGFEEVADDEFREKSDAEISRMSGEEYRVYAEARAAQRRLKARKTVPPDEDETPTPWGGNLTARRSSLFPTPGERMEQFVAASKAHWGRAVVQPATSTADKNLSPIEKFAEASKARWSKK